MNRACCLFMLMGCRIAPIERDPLVDVTLSTPGIDTFTLICDVERERWQLDVVATSWTGGGEWWWTVDGDYVEKHSVYSRKAAQDGSWDELRLRLNIVADWRDASRNVSTPFLCASEPTGRFLLFDPNGDIVDCTDFGTNTQWLSTDEDLPPCLTD